jgi:hypothetical protein
LGAIFWVLIAIGGGFFAVTGKYPDALPLSEVFGRRQPDSTTLPDTASGQGSHRSDRAASERATEQGSEVIE